VSSAIYYHFSHSSNAEFRPPKHPKLEEEMVLWLEELSEAGETITDAKIQRKALGIADELRKKYGTIGSGKEKDENFKASSGWIENFKHRHGIKGGVWHGRVWHGRRKADEHEITDAQMASQEPEAMQLATVPDEHYIHNIQPDMAMEIEGPPDDIVAVEELPKGVPSKEQAERAYCILTHYLDSNVQSLEPLGYTPEHRQTLHDMFLKVFFKTSSSTTQP